MNIQVAVNTHDLEKAFRKAPLLVAVSLNQWITRTTALGEREAKKQVSDHVDTGQLQSSIHGRVHGLKGEVKPDAKHAIFVHEGRKPGKMPPFQKDSALASWAERKHLNPFLVARAIALHGIKPDRFMDAAYKKIKPAAERDGQNVLDEIVEAL